MQDQLCVLKVLLQPCSSQRTPCCYSRALWPSLSCRAMPLPCPSQTLSRPPWVHPPHSQDPSPWFPCLPPETPCPPPLLLSDSHPTALMPGVRQHHRWRVHQPLANCLPSMDPWFPCPTPCSACPHAPGLADHSPPWAPAPAPPLAPGLLLLQGLWLSEKGQMASAWPALPWEAQG